MDITIIESKNLDLISPLVEEVQNLHAALFPTVYKVYEKENISRMMEKMLADDQSRIFVAQQDGETIGYILLLIKEVPENAFHFTYRIVHIDQIVVAHNHKKTGVGSMLMEKAETVARELSINRIELDHLDSNTVAADFFKRKAYQPYRVKLSKTLK